MGIFKLRVGVQYLSMVPVDVQISLKNFLYYGSKLKGKK